MPKPNIMKISYDAPYDNCQNMYVFVYVISYQCIIQILSKHVLSEMLLSLITYHTYIHVCNATFIVIKQLKCYTASVRTPRHLYHGAS